MKSFPSTPYPENDVVCIGRCWVSLVATVAFVPVNWTLANKQHNALAYVKTHPCVVLVDCPACDARAGVLCLSRNGQRTVSCHADRKDAMCRHQAQEAAR